MFASRIGHVLCLYTENDFWNSSNFFEFIQNYFFANNSIDKLSEFQ